MENFKWYYVPILIMVWVIGMWLNNYIHRNKYK